MLIGDLQYLHFPLSKMYEITGNKSKNPSLFLHDSQYDLPFIIDSPRGIRSIKTFKKEPIDIPIKKKEIMRISITYLLCAPVAVSRPAV